MKPEKEKPARTPLKSVTNRQGEEAARPKRAPLTPTPSEHRPQIKSTRLFSPGSDVKRADEAPSISSAAARDDTPLHPVATPAPVIKSSARSCMSSSMASRGTLLALEEADPEDVEHLNSVLRSGGEDWRFSFGKGFLFSVPSGWPPTRLRRFRKLCVALGFQVQTSGGRVQYRMLNQQVRCQPSELLIQRLDPPPSHSPLTGRQAQESPEQPNSRYRPL
jgi:hypothetical protein